MPNPSLPSRPYLEFAERLKVQSEALRRLVKAGKTWDFDELSLAALFDQCERHARLLETIRTALKALRDNITSDFAEPDRPDEQPMNAGETALLIVGQIDRIRTFLEQG